MLPFPHSRNQIIRNLRWVNGHWTARATVYRLHPMERWRECQRFLRGWLNTRARNGDPQGS